MRMVGDAKLLFQVFSNLLANAVKYSPGGGVIEVEAATAADRVTVAISDYGIGIPPIDLDRLFDRYHRGSNVSGIVGTGVGLYLVKMVVELHHGSVDVESTEGKGSRFTVCLPINSASSKSAAPTEEWSSTNSASIDEAPSIADPSGGSVLSPASERGQI
jgi:signal transduction histidine kinase